jgi:HAD superfamily phosphoserine phosphatase-like hydrolase
LMTRSAKPVAVFDIDGTIFRSSLLIELTNALVELGVFLPDIKAEYNEEFNAWLNREASYELYIQKVVKAFAGNLKGVNEGQLKTAADMVVTGHARRTYRYTRDLIKQLKNSYFLLAISQSPVEMVSRFAQYYQFDDFFATTYELNKGAYTGVCHGDLIPKNETLAKMVEHHGLSLDGSVGIGDSLSDASFLSQVERPIAFNPNAALFEIAMRKNWQVVVERKDVIYYYNRYDPKGLY